MFQSTPPAQGATPAGAQLRRGIQRFNPRPPRRGRPVLTPEQTRSYLPQDGYDQELTSSYRTGQVLKRHFIHR